MNRPAYQTPRWLLGALFLFWGVNSDMPVYGLMAALLVEGSYLVKRKWELTRDDFIRVSDVSSFIMLGSILLIYLTNEPWQIMRRFVIWLPIIHLPLLLSQLYSTSDRIVIGTRLGLRKGREPHAHRPFNLTWIYAALLVFSAAAANSRAVWFFPFLVLFAVWALFNYRGRRYPAALWTGGMVIVAVVSLFTALSLNNAFLYSQDRLMEYYQLWFARFYADPFKSDTNLGSLSAFKASSRILMRVRPGDGPGAPYYLTDGVFDTYAVTSWYNRDPRSRPVPLDENARWVLREPAPPVEARVDISAWLPRNKGVLPLPQGAHLVSRLNAAGLKELALGPVLVEEGPELLDYTAHYLPGADHAAPPSDRDLMVPADELPGLDAAIAEMAPATGDPRAVIDALDHFFLFRFTYSLDAVPYAKQRTAVSNFLMNQRRGHCEYFATATVLLLRRLGIPARYKTGFLVDEWSPIEETYVVRERHGHAWATAWVGGAWIDLDTTPPGWIVTESLAAGPFERVRDLFAYLGYRYEKFRQLKDERVNQALLAGIVILSAILLYRIYAQRRRKEAGAGGLTDLMQYDTPGKDSPFHAVAELLATIGVARLDHETYGRWALRIDEVRRGRGDANTPFVDEEFMALLSLHERYRFDPRGLTAEEKERFIADATAWLERHRPKQ
ncbi:MAG TPA: transglutaminase domain-containing protein [bacterium]|nr:transglutaminase domain-containing protein [bacterium]